METLKRKRVGKVVRDVSEWVEKNEEIFERIEEIQFKARIVLKIKRYMRANGFSQKQLAKKLEVKPQYVNKLLHGEISDMKISTAIRYGKRLGISLIAISDDYVQMNEIIVLKSTVSANPYYQESNYDYRHTNHFVYQQSSPISQKKNKYGSRPS